MNREYPWCRMKETQSAVFRSSSFMLSGKKLEDMPLLFLILRLPFKTKSIDPIQYELELELCNIPKVKNMWKVFEDNSLKNYALDKNV